MLAKSPEANNPGQHVLTTVNERFCASKMSKI